jgi:hypothetical protein
LRVARVISIVRAVNLIAAASGFLVIAFVLWDAFETILLPRRIPSGLRISRLVLRGLWGGWSAIARRIVQRNARENVLSLYALLSLIGLLVVWAAGLIVGFACIQWAFGSRLETLGGPVGFRTDLYMSGTTFFTLGLGDVSPISAGSRFLTVVEAGTGFGFLAMVLAYLPVLYQAFSRREARITMLDEWAGSPPSAAVLLRRSFESRDPGAALNALLRDWEVAAAEILESHLSYPILAYFRSQHDNQSWLAALTTVLDSCALVIAGVDGIDPFQARLTFAICRHTLVDVSQNVENRARPSAALRATPEQLVELRAWLNAAGIPIARGEEADRRFAELRALYAPYVLVLSERLLMPLPSWLPPAKARYNWETTAWARTGRDDAH